MKADLHCHTNLSDCSMSFAEILDIAVEEEVTHLAITNHDTSQGLEGMIEQGRERGVEIIPGIEISAYDFGRGRRVHILGYYIQPEHPALRALCDPIMERRREAAPRMVSRIKAAGYRIDWDEVMELAQGGTVVYKQHIMHALIENGYADTIYGDLYEELFSRGQDGQKPGIAYMPMEYADAAAAVQAVRAAGGVPVLAHPGPYRSFETVAELVEAGLAGIEVRHPLHGPEDEDRARAYAEQYGLVMTGGTDYHGWYGESEVILGSKDPGQACVEALKAKAEHMQKAFV
ncbi:PHP domain-containing protein [Paenibacillus sp. S-38]|uniref:PHP domain-containing protein n=1 Tax=Paenibacillus sp. S-38 TaxID=3416710 RepID=UPI003CE98420